MSPQELQGKYAVALGRIGGGTGLDGSDPQKPIYKRNAHMAEQQAVRQAANALTALWKLKTADKI